MSKNRKQSKGGMTFNFDTPDDVMRILDALCHTGIRVRLVLGDTDTGKEWLEECDVMGYIGMTTGIRSPILLHSRLSMGGGLISTDRILRILDVKTKRELYRHPRYKPATWTMVECKPIEAQGRTYRAQAFANGELQAQFETAAKAQHYIAFMKGERMSDNY